MQLSIPNRSLRFRVGPYSRAIVGYGIHSNHPAECTTPARGSCRPLLGIYLRSSSFRHGFRGFLRNLNLWATSEATARTGASRTFLQESITTMPEVPEKPQNLFEIKGVLTKFMRMLFPLEFPIDSIPNSAPMLPFPYPLLPGEMIYLPKKLEPFGTRGDAYIYY